MNTESTLTLKMVATVRETQPIKGWVYRISSSDKGSTLMRTPEGEPYWGHGIIKQVYQPEEKKFVPACQSHRSVYMSFDDAMAVVRTLFHE